MKEEALKLADELEDLMFSECDDAAAMIRRLVEELDKKPLSDDEIEQIAIRYYVGSRILPIQYARAIEERHGIK